WIKWHMLGRWLPPYRIDEHPLLMHSGALMTILFELSFIFLIFGRRTRILAGLAGVTFHTSLNVFMRHGFETLRNCYVIFVDWYGLLQRLRGRLRWRRSNAVAADGEVAQSFAAFRAPAVPVVSMRSVRHVLSVLAEKRVLAVSLVGGALVAANVWAGAMRMKDAWP